MDRFVLSKYIFYLVFLCTGIHAFSQHAEEKQADVISYKSASDTVLYLHHVAATNDANEGQRPAMVFFFGGGWKGGTVEQFRPHAAYFSNLGIECFLADYRVESRQGTTPFDAVEDAKSAVRFIRENSGRWDIDAHRIIAAGGSAGGHLAAAAGNIIGLDKATENLEISSRANALVLFNPVYDNGPEEYGFDRVGDRYLEISPVHNITKGAPPTIVFFGTEDPLVSVETSLRYRRKMQEVGSRCDLHLYDGQKHGFFNFRNKKYYHETVYQTHLFLHELGYVADLPHAIHHQLSVEKSHAHNDYRHAKPLEDALLQGFVSVEADILNQGNKLFVGHDREELDAGDLSTFEELYLQPLFRRFQVQGRIDSTRASKDPFYLWIDIKYNAAKVYALLKKQIHPYREMLTSRENGEVKMGAVTLILSGDRPIDLVQADDPQYFFLDGRTSNIDGDVPPGIMPFISENIATVLGGRIEGGILTTGQEKTLEEFIDNCHQRGFQVRFWNTPDHADFWRKLHQLNVDLINTDHLKGLRSFLMSQE